MRIVTVQLAAGVLIAAGLAPAFGQGWQRQYQKGMQSERSDDRREAIEAVDPDDRSAVKALLAVLGIQDIARVDWYQIEAAVDQLARVTRDRSRKELEKYLKKFHAIVLNGEVRVAPEFQSRIQGAGIITGGFTSEEIGEIMGVPAATVRTRIYYGLKSMRKALTERGLSREDFS